MKPEACSALERLRDVIVAAPLGDGAAAIATARSVLAACRGVPVDKPEAKDAVRRAAAVAIVLLGVDGKIGKWTEAELEFRRAAAITEIDEALRRLTEPFPVLAATARRIFGDAKEST